MALGKYAALAVAQAEAQAAGLCLEYYDQHEASPVPCTDGNVIKVPEPQLGWSQGELDQWLDGLSHEIGHNLPECRDCFTIVEETGLNTQSLLGTITNLIEDNRVDKVRTLEFPGTLETYRRARSAQTSKVMQSMNIDDPAMQVIFTCFDFDTNARGAWGPSFENPMFWDAKATAEMKGWRAALEAYADRYHTTNARESLDLAQELLRDVFKINDPQAFDKQSQSGKGKGQGENDTKGEKQSGQEKTNGEGQGDPEKLTDLRYGSINWSEVLKHGHNPSDHKEGGSHIEYDVSSGYYVSHSPDTIKIVEGKALDAQPKTCGENLDACVKGLDIKSMVGQARRYLQAKTVSRTVTHQQAGKLDVTKLYKLAKPMNNYTVYKTKTINDKLDTVVSILVDWSGSMSGANYGVYSKRQTALAGAVALTNLLKPLHIKHEIALFSEGCSYNYHFVLKGFMESASDEQLVARAGAAYSICASGNADGESIEIAASRLAEQQAKRHVLIVLSDGCPSGMGGDGAWHLEYVVRTLEKLIGWSIIGIGIEDKNVKRFYTNSRIVKSAAQLPQAIIETLKQSILELK